MDGSFENSDLISSKLCHNASALQMIYQEGSMVFVATNTPTTVLLLNSMGQVLQSQQTEALVQFETSQFAAGMYQVVLMHEDGSKETETIMVH